MNAHSFPVNVGCEERTMSALTKSQRALLARERIARVCAQRAKRQRLAQLHAQRDVLRAALRAPSYFQWAAARGKVNA